MNAIEYVSGFSRLGKKLEDLSRIKSLMQAVGDPQDKLKFIHIAGTNGKGSMAQMFSEIFINAGYRTGLFTSPYIVDYTDRIKVNNENITLPELEKIIEKIRPAVEEHPLRSDFSQFEITQAIAFTYFAEKKCDVVILEAGIGGLLDSTNVIKAPIVSVIGSVDFDHTAVLGDTLEKIAFQKAGIIKRRCPCVLAPGNSMEVVRTVREQAADREAMLNIPNLNLCRVEKSDIYGSTFFYRGEKYDTSMAGLHQVSNALTVIDAMRLASEKIPVTQENIAAGIKSAKLFGRVEVIKKQPLTILDGAHNPDGIKALSYALKGLGETEINAVIGMHKDKNAAEAVKYLVPLVDTFVTVDGFSDRDLDKKELADIIKNAGGNAIIGEEDIMQEIEKLQVKAPSGATVICGSLFLAAYVKQHG